MHLVRALVVSLGLVAPATGQAGPGDLSDPVMIFADCAGRFSAEMEHSWLMGHDPAEVTRQRAMMIDLVDAARPADAGPAILATRIEAKFAQAALLQRASFTQDPQQARQARATARAALERCLFLMTS